MEENATNPQSQVVPLGYRGSAPPDPNVNHSRVVDGRTVVWVLSVGFALFSIVGALFILPKFRGIPHDANLAQATQDLNAMTIALDTFDVDVGRYPTSTEGLLALTTAPANVTAWRGSYLPKAITLDPWGRPYVYASPGKHNPRGFDLSSTGRDGKFGTADDLDNWTVGQ